MDTNYRAKFILYDKKVFILDEDGEIYKHINLKNIHSDDSNLYYASNFALTIAKANELLSKGKAKARSSLWDLEKPR